jgi:iron-sulfur cluster repair protein YtfE (RIC family)
MAEQPWARKTEQTAAPADGPQIAVFFHWFPSFDSGGCLLAAAKREEPAMNETPQCTALLEHIQQVHHQLNVAVTKVRRRLAELQSVGLPLPADVIEQLHGLRAELGAHFAEEEEGGCFDELAARSATASQQIRQMEAEHRELLPMIDRLIAAGCLPAGKVQEFSQRFEELADRLRAHEMAESRLFQYALGGEASDYDIEGHD